MSWTAPRTWIAGETVTAGLMNTHLRDNLIALRDSIPSATIYQSGNQSIPNGGAGLSLTSILYDTDGMADGTNSRMVVQTAGTYFVVASIHWADNASGNYVGCLTKLGGTVLGTGRYEQNLNTGFNGHYVQQSFTLGMAVGALLNVTANQNSGVAISTLAGSTETFLHARRITT